MLTGAISGPTSSAGKVTTCVGMAVSTNKGETATWVAVAKGDHGKVGFAVGEGEVTVVVTTAIVVPCRAAVRVAISAKIDGAVALAETLVLVRARKSRPASRITTNNTPVRSP